MKERVKSKTELLRQTLTSKDFLFSI